LRPSLGQQTRYLVVQTLALGIDRYKKEIVEILNDIIKPAGIFERNDVPVRELEGLEQHKGFLSDKFDTNVLMVENGIKFIVDAHKSINFMQLKGIKTKLFINSSVQRRFDIDSREDFNELMEFFITQKSDGEDDFVRFVNSNLNKIPRLSWIGIITIGVSRELKDNLIMMRDRGYNITVFYSASSLKDLSNMEFLKKIGISCFSFNELIKKQGNRVII
jgi:hypothetical protein